MSVRDFVLEVERVPSTRHLVVLVLFALTTVALIPLEWFIPGGVLWLATLVAVWRGDDAVMRRNMTLLLLGVLTLGFAPINTDLSTPHFFALGVPFALVIFVPYLYLRWKAPHQMDFRFWPRTWAKRDIIYTIISVPLAWGIIRVYFFYLNPELPTHWPMPAEYDTDAVRRLTIGINCVGIWDELFFVNTVFVLLRGVFPYRLANLGQAVVYTSVLYHMAFTGWGIVIVYGFALTQGAMYEKSRILLWVLIVHLIVDAFLVLAILQYHYPENARLLF
jgi:hypothetical protein